MPRLFSLSVVLVGASLLLTACSRLEPTHTHPLDTKEQRMLPISDVAKRLDLEVREGLMAREVYCSSNTGQTFQVGAGRPDVYLCNGYAVKVEYPGIQWTNGEVTVPIGMYNSMCKDLGRIDLMIKGEGTRAESGLNINLTPPATPDFGAVGSTTTTNGPATGTKPVPAATTGASLKGKVIVIDAGHGGKDPGGIGKHGALELNEKDVALNVSLAVKKLLESQGAKVIMTRTTDVFVELAERAEIANRNNADFFVSIHANIAGAEGVAGAETYFQAGEDRGAKSGKLAKSITDSVVASSGAQNRGAKADERGLRVLKNTKMPAVLVELGYMSNADEAKKLSNSQYQTKLALGVADGISAYVKG